MAKSAPMCLRVHHHVGATVGLAGDDGDARHGRLGEGVEELGAAADDPLVLLGDTGQEAGHVVEDEQRHVEGVTGADEAGGLLAGGDVDRARQVARLVGDDPDRVPIEPAETADDVRRVAGLDLEELAARRGSRRARRACRTASRSPPARARRAPALPAPGRHPGRTRADPRGCSTAGTRGDSESGR